MNSNQKQNQLLLFDYPPNEEDSIKTLSYTDRPDNKEAVIALIHTLLEKYQQPSARELIKIVENELGVEARWDLRSALNHLASERNLTRADRQYCQTLIEDGSLDAALRGEGSPEQETCSTIDSLLRQSIQYRDSKAFQEMIEFMGQFRDYAPYNNMLVRLQNPSCSFYATARDWKKRFDRDLKEDARPMLILAPMHPVLLVYDIDQTEGDKLPDELKKFARFSGKWKSAWLTRMMENAAQYLIRVDFKELSSTRGGFATFARGKGEWKMRIAIHSGLDEPSRFGVLCHELAHIFLGHLGTDSDLWWPSRSKLEHSTIEIEAEAVSYIITSRLGLSGSSAAYVSRYLTTGEEIPKTVSTDLIAKVAGKLERMSRETLPKPKRKHSYKNTLSGILEA